VTRRLRLQHLQLDRLSGEGTRVDLKMGGRDKIGTQILTDQITSPAVI
jgi:hypothetical protein